MQITFGSLFAGIGGFDLGFERAGMTCKWQVEIDDYATRVLAKHWPNVHRERDIRQCGAHNLERVDVICGGFPCQDISYAGLGAGLDGERSGLFFEAIRVVQQLKPRVVVLENVAALLTRGLDRVLGTLAEIGYNAEWHCIPAAAVGAPHIRDRVFVLGYANSDRWDARKQTSQTARRWHSTVSTGCDAASMADTDGRKQRRGTSDEQMGWQWLTQKTAFDGDTRRVEWLTEPDVGRVAHGVSARVDRLRGLGNAVVPQVAEWIGLQVVEQLQD